jgi:hypothetical protein
LEWGDVQTDENGNSTIRYRFESSLITGVRQLWCEDFTFDKEGNFVSETTVDGYPRILGEAQDAKNKSAGLSLTHRVVFGAKDDFKVTSFDDIYKICQPAFENANVRWMYAKIDKDENGKQIFQTLTNEPENVRKIIESLPQFVYIKTEPVTRELFVNHTASWRNLPKTDRVPVTSIKDLLNVPLTETYRVDKKIIDFPEKFDLSTPENAYVTQKQLIITNDKDKIEQLLKMQYGEGMSKEDMPERERRQLEQKIPEDWQKTYKTKFIVYEVLKFSDDVAFVFSLRQFDNLYDGNLFKKKDDGLWYNCGNLQNFRVAEMAEKVQKSVEFLLPKSEKSVTSIKDLLNTKVIESYRVDKKIIDFPEKFDLSTPENSYVTQKQLIISNDKDKIEQLLKASYSEGISQSPSDIPERERRQLEQKIPEDWQKTYKTKFIVYEVLKFSDNVAFVFSLRQFDNLYDGNLFKKKDDGLWYNYGNFQDFKVEEMAKDIDKALKSF